MVIRSRPCKPSAPPRGRRVFWFCRIERCACRDSALPLPGRRCPWATEARPFRAGGARRLRDERALGAGKHAREDRRVHRARLGVWQSGRSAAERLLGALHADDHADGAGAVSVLRADRRRGAVVGGRGARDRRVAGDDGADDLHDGAGSGRGIAHAAAGVLQRRRPGDAAAGVAGHGDGDPGAGRGAPAQAT